MTRRIVQCDGAAIPVEWASEYREGPTVQLNRFGPSQQVSLRFQELSDPLAGTLDGKAFDLVSIAAYVYVADQLVSRGGEADIYGKSWRRELAVCLPVLAPGFWNSDLVRSLLEQTLSFVSGEVWHFAFSASLSPGQLQMGNIDQQGVRYNPDSVILFSGGADSLCATVESVWDHRLKPVLVSHRSVPLISTIQKGIVEQLRKKIPSWQFPYSQFVVNKVKTDEHDTTQRTRSFLFAALGTAVASSLGIDKVILADSGVVSLDLPINGQLLGSLASRSTHPRFLDSFNTLARMVLPYKPQISNPLWARTKADGLEILKRHGVAELLLATNSCAHRRNLSNEKPQCGVCSQCVDRRFATLIAGLEQYDPVDRYRKDIFRDALNGNDLTMVQSYVRFAKKVLPLSPEELYLAYPQLAEAILTNEPSPDIKAREYASLIRCHAASVIDVVENQVRAASRELVLDLLPATCLIHLSVQAPATAYASQEQTSSDALGEYVFKRQGDFWVTVFEGKQHTFKHSLGLEYINHLLVNPNKDMDALQLVMLRNKREASPTNLTYLRMSKEQLAEQGLSVSGLGDAGAVLDNKAKEEYRDRIRGIDEELEEAEQNNDTGRVESLHDEKDFLLRELAAAVGLGGRDRKAANALERARIAVSQSIKRAIRNIGQYNKPLAQFLTNSIKTGNACVYQPDREIPWVLDSSEIGRS